MGQLHGHTLENKWKIYNEVKRCGMKHIIVAAFSHMTRVDDEFIRQLRERGEDFSMLYAFTEITESINNKRSTAGVYVIPGSLFLVHQHFGN